MMHNEILEKRRQQLHQKRTRRKVILQLLSVAVITYISLHNILGIALVHGESMQPTLVEGDLLIFNRLVSNYQPQDTVVLSVNDINDYLVKRIIGMPGDEINITEDGTVIRNGKALEETYGKTTQGQRNSYPLKLAKGEYFVLGDNRSNSMDSRDFGVVRKSDLKGKVMLVVLRKMF